MQDFVNLLLHSRQQAGFRYNTTTQRLTSYHQASFCSGSNLFLVATGTGTAAQDYHHIDIIFRQRHKLKISPLLSHLDQMTGYPAQIHMRITGTTILQCYLNFTTIL